LRFSFPFGDNLPLGDQKENQYHTYIQTILLGKKKSAKVPHFKGKDSQIAIFRE
jgi:hypothetical protein